MRFRPQHLACLIWVAIWPLLVPLATAQTEPQSSVAEANSSASATESTAAADTDANASEPAGNEVTADAEDTAKTSNSGSSEVEYNEDNYRRFMELKDRDPRTSTMPTNAYQSGSQKLDELPETSQKHLRNQLREVIVEEGEWQKGDENKGYAYVPSPAAESDRELQLKEAAAWDELVDKYQEREAQIHSNSARSQAAKKAGDAAGGSSNSSSSAADGDSSSNASSGADGGQQAQSGQASQQSSQQSTQSEKDQSQNEQTTAAMAAQREEARSAGVSQNALDFLTQSRGGVQQGQGPQQGQQPTQQQGSQKGQPGQQSQQYVQGQQGQSQQKDQSQPQDSQQNPQSDSDQSNSETSETIEQTPATLAENSDQTSDSGENSEMAEATEQQDSNPLPKLKSPIDSPLVNSTDDVSNAGTTQNAFEALSRGAQPAAAPADTLSIEDLINAKGVSGETIPQGPSEDGNSKTEEPD